MRLVVDNTTRAAALVTIRELINAGLAGNDSYDYQLFVVDAPQEQRDLAEIALDHLGAELHKNGAYRAPTAILQCRLPNWARAELGLDDTGAPIIVVPLASRGLTAAEHLELGSSPGEIAALRGMDHMIDSVVAGMRTEPVEPTDDQIYNRPGVEGGIAYPLAAEAMHENDWRL